MNRKMGGCQTGEICKETAFDKQNTGWADILRNCPSEMIKGMSEVNKCYQSG